MPSSEYFFHNKCDDEGDDATDDGEKKLCQLLLKKSDTHEVENRARTFFCSVPNAKKPLLLKTERTRFGTF